MKFIWLIFVALLALPANAQSTACIWSGSLAECLPVSGLILKDQRDLRMGEAKANGTDYAAIQAPASFTTYTLTLPSDDGDADQVLTTNGSGVLDFTQVSLTAGVTGVLPIANGGTGQITAQLGINALAGAVTDNRVLQGNGTNIVLGQIDTPSFFTTGAVATASEPGVLTSNVTGKDLTTAPVYDGNVPGDDLITGAMLAAGGIVQYDSDANGTCWRYEVGLQICTGTATGNLSVNNATGPLWRSADTTWTYALAFSATPIFLGTATRSAAADNQPAYIGAQSSPGTSSASYNVVSTATNTGQGWNRRFFAIGLWK